MHVLQQAQKRANKQGLPEATPLARSIRQMAHNIHQCPPGSVITNQLLRASKRLKTDPRLDPKKQNMWDCCNCRLCVLLDCNAGTRDILPILLLYRVYTRVGYLFDSSGVSSPISLSYPLGSDLDRDLLREQMGMN